MYTYFLLMGMSSDRWVSQGVWRLTARLTCDPKQEKAGKRDGVDCRALAMVDVLLLQSLLVEADTVEVNTAVWATAVAHLYFMQHNHALSVCPHKVRKRNTFPVEVHTCGLMEASFTIFGAMPTVLIVM